MRATFACAAGAAALILVVPSAHADCAAVEPTKEDTVFERDRLWLHEPGWFEPLDAPAVARLADEGYADDAVMMSVQAGGETRAWPVAAMAYHHVANDRVGGVPIAVTY